MIFDNIWAYIFEELQNPTVAQNTVDGILNTIEKLKEFSEMGLPLSSVTDVESDYRFLVMRELPRLLPRQRR